MGKYDKKKYETSEGIIYRITGKGTAKITTYFNPKGSRKGKWIQVGKKNGDWSVPGSWYGSTRNKKEVRKWSPKNKSWVWNYFLRGPLK